MFYELLPQWNEIISYALLRRDTLLSDGGDPTVSYFWGKNGT